jgi:hypothetical protein
MYLRPLADPQNLLQNPVVRISADGKHATQYSLNGVPGLEKGGILDFGAAAHGNVFLLATDLSQPAGFYVLRFDEAGGFVSKTRLQPGIRPNQLAVFSSGELLVSGREHRDTPSVSATGSAITGIFDFNGQLLRKVEMPGDIKPKTGPLSAEEAAAAEQDYSRALTFSMAASSNDGRIYLMRFGPDYAPVFSISPIGEARPVKVRFPKGTYLNSIKLDGNRLLTMFVRKEDPKQARIDEIIFSVWDLDSGEELEEFYDVSPLVGVALACYQRDVFTFVRTDERGDHLELVKASPGS